MQLFDNLRLFIICINDVPNFKRSKYFLSYKLDQYDLADGISKAKILSTNFNLLSVHNIGQVKFHIN